MSKTNLTEKQICNKFSKRIAMAAKKIEKKIPLENEEEKDMERLLGEHNNYMNLIESGKLPEDFEKFLFNELCLHVLIERVSYWKGMQIGIGATMAVMSGKENAL